MSILRRVLTIEEFVRWAKSDPEKYDDLYLDYMVEGLTDYYDNFGFKTSEEYLNYCEENLEEVNEEDFADVIIPLIEELDDEDYFGSEGFLHVAGLD